MNLFIELRKHGKLAAKRNPMYEKNKFGKFWMYFMAVFWAGYLVFFGTSFAFAFNDGATEAYHVLNSGLIFILCLDFLMRFPFQKTPAQEVKPYLLLPVKTQPSYRLPADTFRIERLQPDMAVLLRSVRHHQHHQILRHNGCTDL